ncbi:MULTISPECIES: hypothetical protein [unclassified Hyphomicrobium]|uniref:hypothetical protein n=1 Tax=unclassified Hyphomicrobium TaxID=2619925 RepID=UPI000213EF74|nr:MULTISPECIES: hypothetical protein [unclassified Hyphomicrobium]CCB64826.1 conserved exported protein of unknown function [Hyphomicrobium sp. MC1]
MHFIRRTILVAVLVLAPSAAWATKPKLDPETCNSLRLEQIKFRQSGILNDMSKGAAWGKANLSPERLREIQHYLELDEQVQFGCRDAKVTAEAKRASEAAARIEINSDADPTAPVAKDPPKPGAAGADGKDTAPKKAAKKTVHKSKPTKSSKAKKAGDKESNAGSSKGANASSSVAEGEVLPWASP